MRTTVSLLCMAVLLAGCAGGGAGGPPPASVNVSLDGAGRIEGMVLTDEQQPIVGAEVGLVEVGATVRTGAAGEFAFGGLAAGEYRVVAEYPLAPPVMRKVTVADGEIAKVVFILVLRAIEEPRVAVVIEDGLIACGISTPFVTGTPGCNDPADKTAITLTIGPGLVATVTEATWTSSSALTGKELFNLQTMNEQEVGEGVQSLSPLRNVHDTYPELKTNATIEDRFYVGFSSTTNPVVLVYQQHFRGYFSHFYYETIPDKYSALP